MPKNSTDSQEKAIQVFRANSGILRTREAREAGIHPRTLYSLRDNGIIERISRGVFRLCELDPLGNPDLLTVSARVSSGVLCLISALSFHEITTQVPHQVWIALERGAEPPRVEYPPLRVFWFSGKAFSEGVHRHEVDGRELKVYSAEKTLADCFKYRNKIGLSIAVEAMRMYRQAMTVNVSDLMRHAAICRVQNVIRPYVEAIL